MSKPKLTFHTWALVALFFGWTALVRGSPLDTATSAELLTTITRPGEAARSVFVPAVHVREGEEVFYTVRIRNTGAAPVQPVVITKPIPHNTRYVADSAAGPAVDIDYSVDGGRTFAAPQQLVVRSKSGRSQRAPVESYTHIRWQLRYPLAPGAVALLRFRVVFK
jgi:uncharacterized repeat protein (TIGR01451 family)